jgi:hypothetical protein
MTTYILQAAKVRIHQRGGGPDRVVTQRAPSKLVNARGQPIESDAPTLIELTDNDIVDLDLWLRSGVIREMPVSLVPELVAKEVPIGQDSRKKR